MLYYLSSCQREHPNANDFTVELCQQIDAANITDGNNYLTAKDMEQKNCRVYSYQLSDGWRGIVLIPNDTFHKSSRQLTVSYFVIFAGFFIILLLFWYNNYQTRAYNKIKKELENEQALGQNLLYRSEHDHLTGLLNRNGYEKVIQQFLVNSQLICLIIIDLDNFKNINDTYGHDMGDKILLNTAIELKRCFRTKDYLVRFGGDEFIVIMQLSDMKDISFIGRKMNRLNKALMNPGNQELPPITVSAGVAFSDNGFSEELFLHADDALYYLKEHGRNGYHIWSPDETTEVSQEKIIDFLEV